MRLIYGIRVVMADDAKAEEIIKAIEHGVLVAIDKISVSQDELFRIPLRRIAIKIKSSQSCSSWYEFNPPIPADRIGDLFAPAAQAVELLLHPEGGETMTVEVSERGSAGAA